jgi:uncharacterized Fe-S cluster protein YjdI
MRAHPDKIRSSQCTKGRAKTEGKIKVDGTACVEGGVCTRGEAARPRIRYVPWVSPKSCMASGAVRAVLSGVRGDAMEPGR